MSIHSIHLKYRTPKRYPTIFSIVPPGVALIITFRGSNYRCLEQIFMVLKGFEPSKFDCIYLYCPVGPKTVRFRLKQNANCQQIVRAHYVHSIAHANWEQIVRAHYVHSIVHAYWEQILCAHYVHSIAHVPDSVSWTVHVHREVLQIQHPHRQV